MLFIWQIPHTFAIAMRRYEEYKAAKVPMLPVVYGFNMTKRQNVVYIACLLPLPLLLISLGVMFVTVALILNIIWLFIAIRGVFVDDNKKYVVIMFYFLFLYLILVFCVMIVLFLSFFFFLLCFFSNILIFINIFIRYVFNVCINFKYYLFIYCNSWCFC